nr:manganese efflux pump MntP family protein [Methanobrevibacter arboriphilus]
MEYFFGGFQAVMPILGWASGIQLKDLISAVAPWIAFILLLTIGIKMVYESLQTTDEENAYEENAIEKSEDENGLINKGKFSFKELTLLSIATSIDAFAIGVTFAILKTPILFPIILIGTVSFVLTEAGILIGQRIGHYFGNKFEIIGGIVLILLGFKILLEGLGIL